MEIERVAIVGAGFMGSGIAEAAAVAGLPVVLRDVNDESLEAAEQRIEGSLTRAVRGGKRDSADAEAVRGRIELTSELDVIADASLVVEAVPEDLRLKLVVMRAIDGVVGRVLV
jgi:3-hydroxybutyryl-CoA dehydrogenase